MEYLIILGLFILNGLFAMSEIALVSSKRARLEEKAKKGSKGAKIALKLLDEPEKFLSTVQIGITLIGIIAGAFGGLAFADDLVPVLQKISWLAPYADKAAIAIVVTVITYLSLVIGELVPKTIAFNNPEGITVALAPVMKLLSWITTPVVSFLSFSTKIFLKILMIKKKERTPVTEEELKILIEKGTQFGTLEHKESELLKRIFRFGDRRAYEIMTNRQDVIVINIKDTLERIKQQVYENPFSRYPVYDETPDNIFGIFTIKDFFHSLNNKPDFRLKDILTQPLFIPDNLTGIKVFEKFQKTKTYVAIVIDEYGSFEGIITLHDLIENIFGDLPDKHEEEEIAIIKRDDGSLLIDGSILIDELKEHLHINFEDEENYSTLGGFMMYKLNRIPKAGDKFEYKSEMFEIVDMDGKRVDKVLVTRIENSEPE
ncbi:MAG: HlyC/CorC family transporter [Ignavibacteriota bacterium]|nr:HlyC/CorC family transporter [Ignavibacteriota bacterium]MBW7841221.1 HlyC/CorC family transporter [Ignavibacterium sp.]MCO6448744.1 HlyC/CorC family transporter [Ignavibacterium album]MCZ2268059.1 hemolysin family protein [Ignavibacteriales bacterium]HOJ07132.1 hemolysin family protein [Ignavibacteriaceae bacterium]